MINISFLFSASLYYLAQFRESFDQGMNFQKSGKFFSAGGPGQLWQIFVGQYLWVVSRIFVVCLEDICRGIGPEICLQVGIISHRLSANDRRLDNANHPEENSKLSERRDAQLAQAQLAVCPWETLRLTKSRKMYFQNNLRCYLYLVQHVKSWTHMESWKDKKGAKSTRLPFPRNLIRTFWPDGPWWPLDLPLNA